jgi:hypothetical protein
MDLFAILNLFNIFSCSFCRSFTAFFAQNTTCFQKHVYAFVDFLGKVLVSALKVRKLLLKFLQTRGIVLKSFSISEVTLHSIEQAQRGRRSSLKRANVYAYRQRNYVD